MLPSDALPKGTDRCKSRSSGVERPTQFQKQLLLLGEMHELDIAQIQKSHTDALEAIQEENARLRELVELMQAAVPKEHQTMQEEHTRLGDRVALLDTLAPKEIRVVQDTSTAFKDSGALIETVVPEAMLGVKTQVYINSPTEQHIAKIEGTADGLDEDAFGSSTESFTIDGFEVRDVDGFCIKKESLTIASIDLSLESNANAENVLDRSEPLQSERHSMQSLQSARESVKSARESVKKKVSIDTSGRALDNWFSLCRTFVLLCSQDASRVHAAWHSATSQLAQTFEGAITDVLTKSNSRTSWSEQRSSVSTLEESFFQSVSDRSLGISHRVTHRFAEVRRSLSLEPYFVAKTYVLDPNSKYRMLWDLCSVLWCVHDFIMMPIQFVGVVSSEDTSALVRSWLVTIFWTCDIVMSVSTGFYRDDSTVEYRRSKIITQYVKTWMCFDVCILIQDWISIVFSGFTVGLGIMKITRLLRMVRLMRAIRLLPKLWAHIGQINSERISTIARLLHHVTVIILVNHYLACVVLGTWAEAHGYLKPLNAYLRCLHWALAHSTLGSMDMFPTTSFERVWTCLILVLSMVVFTAFLSSISNSVTHVTLLAQEQTMEEKKVRDFFVENQITRELGAQIWHHMSNYRAVASHSKLSDIKSFTLLPTPLRAELAHQTFLPYLVVHPLFEMYNGMEPEALAMLCSKGIEQMFLHPAEEYGCDLRAVTRMIFVNKGSLVYQPQWNIAKSKQVGCHEWVCEEALWAEKAILDGPLSAELLGSDLMLVVPAALRSISRKFTASMPFLVSYAGIFISRFNDACLDEDDEDPEELLFNRPQMIHSMVVCAISEESNRNRFSERVQRGILMQVLDRVSRRPKRLTVAL